jgi:hypothetical protein
VKASNYRVWGRVEHIGVRQFIAIASGVPENHSDVAIVLTSVSPDLAEATQQRDQLMREVGAKVRARGDRVVDVEAD